MVIQRLKWFIEEYFFISLFICGSIHDVEFGRFVRAHTTPFSIWTISFEEESSELALPALERLAMSGGAISSIVLNPIDVVRRYKGSGVWRILSRTT